MVAAPVGSGHIDSRCKTRAKHSNTSILSKPKLVGNTRSPRAWVRWENAWPTASETFSTQCRSCHKPSCSIMLPNHLGDAFPTLCTTKQSRMKLRIISTHLWKATHLISGYFFHTQDYTGPQELCTSITDSERPLDVTAEAKCQANDRQQRLLDSSTRLDLESTDTTMAKSNAEQSSLMPKQRN